MKRLKVSTPWERIGELAARLSRIDDRTVPDFAREADVERGPLGREDAYGLRAERRLVLLSISRQSVKVV